ncbi:hypothetical protein L596_014334 [Steinernema carpocapsae]|uniref:Uncharacterized protein n=1 Tax=Steinernema carpocapsae TaxID=34508 RepID=A0A4U5NBU3_STECR|nr:hypothetical protein L596_014334 [Steinernema carpocapsae]
MLAVPFRPTTLFCRSFAASFATQKYSRALFCAFRERSGGLSASSSPRTRSSASHHQFCALLKPDGDLVAAVGSVLPWRRRASSLLFSALRVRSIASAGRRALLAVGALAKEGEVTAEESQKD